MDTENKKEWESFKEIVIENRSKSQDDFEKYINLMASGALGITITYFDKIVKIDKAVFIWIIILGWVLLITTLVLNLISHRLAVKYADKLLLDLHNKDTENAKSNNSKQNEIMDCLNNLSIIFLILGLIAIFTFLTLNFYK
jgi:hypothetical protein